jgi:phosphomannomutase
MTLIQSISGIRGTLGGKPGETLSPVDIVQLTGAFGMYLQNLYPDKTLKVVIGRDARTSGLMVARLVIGTLQAAGIHVVDTGITTTPTVAMAVPFHEAQGGIVITASHNPRNWNALKFLNVSGEIVTASEGCEIQSWMSPDKLVFSPVEKLGSYSFDEGSLEMHIEKIISLPAVDTEAIGAAGFVVAVDGVNSSGGTAMPLLLEALGVKKVVEVYCEPNGIFPHNPEPLPENLGELSQAVIQNNAHLGFAVDPDVDRLAIISEDGEFFGEEYTLVAVADYILDISPGNTVSNLSSTHALKDITEKRGLHYFASAVGEVNVVEAMKKNGAVIGGEGNGGVIYPPLHYGRDALLGAALFLSSLARSGKTCSALRKKFPEYYISKNKVELPSDIDLRNIMEQVASKYRKQPVDRTDGIKISFDREWVHLRRSNTESIIRIYAESDHPVKAENLAEKLIIDIREFLKGELEE